MTFSKHLSVLCAIATGAICLTVRAADTDNAAQAAARIAIAKALFQQQSNAPAASTASTAPATWSTPADTNVVMHSVDDKDAEKQAKAKAKADKAAAKAKAKADKEAAEAKAQQDAAQAEADKKAQEEAAKKAAMDAKAAADQQQAQAIADKAAADAAAKTEADKKVNAEKAAIAAATPATEAQAPTAASMPTNSWATAMPTNSQAATPAKKEKKKKKEKEQAQAQAVTNAVPAAAQQPGAELGMKPIAAPPLPISASKQDRLAALLQKYQADQITPDEYHSQRAAILAEP